MATKSDSATLIRWLHLSDFHVGKDKYAQQKMFKEILQNVEERIRLEGEPHFIFITGDVANSGKADEYEEFLMELILPLEEALEGGETTILIVPGNHDVDRDEASVTDWSRALETQPRFLDPTEESQKQRKQIQPRFAAFAANDAFCIPDKWLESTNGTFVVKQEIFRANVGVLGVNTAWLSQNDKDRNRLTPGFPLVERGLEAIADCDVRIVLGHHPLSWLTDNDSRRIRTLMAKHAVLYLHGHLHRIEAEAVQVSGYKFLTLQAGAAFQAREEEIWKNRLLWCEIDLQKGEVRANPQFWSSDHQEWKLDTEAFLNDTWIEGTDWWVFPLPTLPQGKGTKGRDEPQIDVPDGWEFLNRAFLEKHRGEIHDDEMLRFFDGSRSSWKHAMSAKIPTRRIVGTLRNAITDGIEGVSGPRLIVLQGASGEGKSTAFLQTLYGITQSNTDWSVLWRHDESAQLQADWIAGLPSTGSPWLIATDNAEQVVSHLSATLSALKVADRRDVHFLLVAKDTDWRAAQRDNDVGESTWRKLAEYKPIILRGLNEDDAKLIVDAWSRLGEKGLGHLAEVELSRAAERLVEAAKAEAAGSKEGAFLGAMLRVRYGDDFKEYVRALLYRLKERAGPGGTLLDAFAYIAAMHSEDLLILSKPVLSEILGCTSQELKSKILYPLGEEAAAVSGTYILTRHKAIAEATMEIFAESDLCDDTDALFTDLCGAAIGARLGGEYVPQLHKWDYAVPEHFSETDRPSLAIACARVIYESDPTNDKHLVNLCMRYRKAGEPKLAIELFREVAEKPEIDMLYNRIHLTEWGAAEGVDNNYQISVWLYAMSIADFESSSPPDNEKTKISLAAVGLPLAALYDQFHEQVYNDARSATAQLGLQLRLDEPARGYLTFHLRESQTNGAPEMTVNEAIETLKAGVEKAVQSCPIKERMANCLIRPSALTFNGLKSLIQNVAQKTSASGSV